MPVMRSPEDPRTSEAGPGTLDAGVRAALAAALAPGTQSNAEGVRVLVRAAVEQDGAVDPVLATKITVALSGVTDPAAEPNTRGAALLVLAARRA